MDHQLKFFVKYRYFIGILTEFLESGKKNSSFNESAFAQMFSNY